MPACLVHTLLTHTTEELTSSSPSLVSRQPSSFYPSDSEHTLLRAFALSVSMWLAPSTPEELSSNVIPSGCPLAISLIHCAALRML